MDEQHITGSEFVMLIASGLLLPWIMAVAIQTRIYIRKGVPKLHWLISSLAMLLITPILGVAIWSGIPLVTVGWQHLIFRLPPNTVTNFLGFVPIAPMVVSTLLASIPITLWYTRRHGNA
ncbi:MAG: hypothetical protein KZQ93_00005 [Candidatus Thiodiazotropha sp. (ex Monitilora ramsayi)]|nr:hypothetical protein [Candidatus Thiodiazotropha sp. (ex Monitilora ramsayi)]